MFFWGLILGILGTTENERSRKMNDAYLIGFASRDSDDEGMEGDFLYRLPEREVMIEEIEDKRFNFNDYEGFSAGREGAE